jgi:hypothetical protein
MEELKDNYYDDSSDSEDSASQPDPGGAVAGGDDFSNGSASVDLDPAYSAAVYYLDAVQFNPDHHCSIRNAADGFHVTKSAVHR